jgi:hypothetical protein
MDTSSVVWTLDHIGDELEAVKQAAPDYRDDLAAIADRISALKSVLTHAHYTQMARDAAAQRSFTEAHADHVARALEVVAPLTTWFVSFPIGSPRGTNYTTIDAPDEAAARRAVIAFYGRDGFCSTYRSAEDLGAEKYGLKPIAFGS